jgi:multiple sugar transport system substrate-binding protein
MTTRVLGILAATSALASGALAQEAVTLQVATHYSDEQVAPLIECFRAFEAENPGVTVEHQVASYGDFLQPS